jgi:hypothetical protein
MAKISSYPSDANVTTSDRLIGSDNENSNETKNFQIGDIINLAQSIITPPNTFVPYTGATGNVDLGNNSVDADVIHAGDVYANNLFNSGGNPSVFIGNDALQPVGLLINTSTNIFKLGDYNGNFNATHIAIEDGSTRITFVGGFNLSNGQGTAGQVLTSAGAGATPTWTSPAVLYSATFFDTTTQNNGGATVANQVLINSTQAASGFTLGPDNRINVLNAGTYFFSANMQLTFTGGASNYNVTVWYTVNDVIVPNSAFTFTTTGAQNDQTLATITDTITLAANDYLKFYWWSQATGMKLLATAAGIFPARPLSPSVNVSIFNVG